MTSILVRGGRKDRKFQFLRFLGLIFNSADRFLTFFDFFDILFVFFKFLLENGLFIFLFFNILYKNLKNYEKMLKNI